MRIIRRSIQALKSAGVKTILRVITSRKHTVEETLRQFTVKDLDDLDISGSPVVPVGRARGSSSGRSYSTAANGAEGTCHPR